MHASNKRPWHRIIGLMFQVITGLVSAVLIVMALLIIAMAGFILAMAQLHHQLVTAALLSLIMVLWYGASRAWRGSHAQRWLRAWFS